MRKTFHRKTLGETSERTTEEGAVIQDGKTQVPFQYKTNWEAKRISCVQLRFASGQPLTDKWSSSVLTHRKPPRVSVRIILWDLNYFLSTAGVKNQMNLRRAAANTSFSLVHFVNILLLAVVTFKESFSYGRAINLPHLSDKYFICYTVRGEFTEALRGFCGC